MNGLPYYKRYPRDFIDGTAGMPFELKGAYSILLDLIYLQGGNLPDDPRYISGLLGVSVRKWKSLRNSLIEIGKIQVSGEFLTNYRAVSELEKLAKYQDKQAENASGPRKNKGLEKPRQSHTESDTDTEEKDVTNVTSKKPPPKAAPVLSILCEVLPEQTAKEWISFRRSGRHKFTEHAARLLVGKLRKMKDPKAAIERSIMNGWTSVYEDERKSQGRGFGGNGSADRSEWLRKVAREGAAR